MLNELKPGTSYMACFPGNSFTTVYTLLENHTATERHHVQYTFLDHSLNKVKITKGATETIRFTEWQANKPWVETYTPITFNNDRYANSKEWTSYDDLYG